jgi:hypothetical protein
MHPSENPPGARKLAGVRIRQAMAPAPFLTRNGISRQDKEATIETLPLDSINDVFDRLKNGKVNGRVVLGIGQNAGRESVTPAD